jgi:hypothetical protein
MMYLPPQIQLFGRVGVEASMEVSTFCVGARVASNID